MIVIFDIRRFPNGLMRVCGPGPGSQSAYYLGHQRCHLVGKASDSTRIIQKAAIILDTVKKSSVRFTTPQGLNRSRHRFCVLNCNPYAAVMAEDRSAAPIYRSYKKQPHHPA